MNEKFPEPPTHLSQSAQELYRYYVGKAARTPGQLTLLLTALEAKDQADQCGAIISREGLTITSKRSGITRQHPLIKVQREAASAMVKAFRMLGLERDSYRTPGLAGFSIDYETAGTEKGQD